jgi:hypothetical protein
MIGPFFLLPNKSKYLEGFPTDQLKQQAVLLWKQLDNLSVWLFMAQAIVTIIICLYYYYPFNNKPGRHYHLKYWGYFLVSAAIISFVLTLCLECFLVKTNIKDIWGVYLPIAISNAIYSVFVYFVVSFIICNIPNNSNAYKWLKI